MIKNKKLRMYEALAHDVAMDAAARRELTDTQRAESRELLAFAHQKLAELESKHDRCRGVRESIRVMQRPSLLKRLTEIFKIQPRAVFAFRDYARLSDDDLRLALENAEQMLERLS
jgi:hypothetical protein